ncbi:CaiB/BaiF CoA transferase family protein [Nocardioides jensenii]|uniref:CaiB/BaiF CoA transferase family protein n=1 Tax=Nocardioides jensenii TaxID=1843 RepID=UPI0014704C8F|nr:CoA transferase [Nocardioides jensenii]
MESDLPLSGVRILDLTSLLPGPFAGQMLVDLGAIVVKVERPGGDPMRHLGAGTFSVVNRGKHSIELDLRDEADRVLAVELASEADVLLENGRPGATAKFGLGFEALKELNPRLVYLSLSGWGQSGPAAGEPGHNANYLSRAGGTWLTGGPGTPPSDAVPVAQADIGAALYGVIGVLAALREPRQARHLDVSLFATGHALLAPRYGEYVDKGMPGRDELLRRPAHGVFEAGDGECLTIAAVEDQFWCALCKLIGRPDLAAREDLSDYAERCRRADEIDAAVARAFRTRPRDAWLALLREHDIPAAPVLRPEEAVLDPQAQHLGIQPDWPVVRAFLPIAGLPRVAGGEPVERDSAGGKIRATRWAEL